MQYHEPWWTISYTNSSFTITLRWCWPWHFAQATWANLQQRCAARPVHQIIILESSKPARGFHMENPHLILLTNWTCKYLVVSKLKSDVVNDIAGKIWKSLAMFIEEAKQKAQSFCYCSHQPLLVHHYMVFKDDLCRQWWSVTGNAALLLLMVRGDSPTSVGSITAEVWTPPTQGPTDWWPCGCHCRFLLSIAD